MPPAGNHSSWFPIEYPRFASKDFSIPTTTNNRLHSPRSYLSSAVSWCSKFCGFECDCTFHQEIYAWFITLVIAYSCDKFNIKKTETRCFYVIPRRASMITDIFLKVFCLHRQPNCRQHALVRWRTKKSFEMKLYQELDCSSPKTKNSTS